ncbi:hypothetical protein [Methanoplanus endosymbiosus]|uniref:Uncharacterized protein n=1 Tax=Methanoplanus endosymbiosus TaxID=33865 RepID=A0A9E7THW6_9EURY|nr:hypothetical protein [Methanoplanus endosymbiosus]UUX93762.1 hypothetical protein L6E24_06520 [Methanoplanus endosymbiosus]
MQENKPLNHRTVSVKFKGWRNKAGLIKIFTPKAVRSGSATYYSQIFTQKEMEIRYGWVAGSLVANIHYIRSQKSVVRNKLLSNAGIEEPEELKDDYKPRICPRCSTIYSYGAIYCNSC